MAVAPISLPPLVREAIAAASAATGADFSGLVETARRESSFRTDARAPTSSAAGLFQFIESTWLDVMRRNGAAHGLGSYANAITTRNGRPFVADAAMRRAILDLRYDPEVSARMAAELTRENADALAGKLGRAPTSGEVYAAHVLGAGGAAKLIDAAARGVSDASSILPEAAAANPWIFKHNGAPRSAAAVLEKLSARTENIVSTAPSAPRPSFEQVDPEVLAASLIDAFFRSAVGAMLELSPDGDGDRNVSGLAAYARAALRTSSFP